MKKDWKEGYLCRMEQVKNAENIARACHNRREMVCDGVNWIQLVQNKIFGGYLWVWNFRTVKTERVFTNYRLLIKYFGHGVRKQNSMKL